MCSHCFPPLQGTDPAADLYKFAEEMKFHKKLSSISLGQGQVSYTTFVEHTDISSHLYYLKEA